MTKDEDMQVISGSSLVLWSGGQGGRLGRERKGRLKIIQFMVMFVFWNSHFLLTSPQHCLQGTQEMHVLYEFTLSKFFVWDYTARDLIVNEPKIKRGEKEKLKLFAVGVFLALRINIITL